MKKLFLIFITLILFVAPLHAELLLFPSQDLVFDNTNSLMWISYPTSSRNWSSQSTYASDLNFSSFSDWRLPTYTELGYLADTSRMPQISSAFNLGFENWSLWTSSATTGSRLQLSSRAYIVFFSDLTHISVSKLSSYPALVVRDATENYLLDSEGNYLQDKNGNFLLGN